jgi:hypothetical protein
MSARDALAALEAGRTAFDLGRTARAVELYERALAAVDADATLPHDSLLAVVVLYHLYFARIRNLELGAAQIAQVRQDSEDDETVASMRRGAWRDDPRALALAQRVLASLLARSDAGTLFTPLTLVERSACEAAQLSSDATPGELPLQRAEQLFGVAADAVLLWPPLSDPAAEEARLRGVAAAARAVLTLHEHGVMEDGRRQKGLVRLHHTTALVVSFMVSEVLSEDTASGGLLHKMRTTCGLTHDEERLLREEVMPPLQRRKQQSDHRDAFFADRDAHLRRAAEDLARHGLRKCALPGCGATEPQPKAFKLCSRCRRACYCSQAHQAADWRRHKREDACAAAPQ